MWLLHQHAQKQLLSKELDASLNTNTKRLFLVKRAVLFLEDAGLPVSIHVLHAGLYVQLH